MASSSDIRAGGAYIEARLKDSTGKGFDAIEKRLKEVGDAVSEIGQKMAIAGLAITAAFVPAILAAGELQDTMGKFDAVYKETSEANRKWAEDFRKQVGHSKQEIYGFMADAQGLLVGIDFDRKSAAEISQTITKLSLDLQSFAGGSSEDAFKALISGISGESEPLKKYGVLLNEAAVGAELLKKGLKADDASNVEKVYARLAIILRSTKDAQGALARESEGFNAQLARAKAGAEDTAAAIGTALLPSAIGLLSTVSGLAGSFADWAAQNPTLLADILKLGGGLIVVGGALAGIGTAISIFTSLKAAALVVSGAIGTMTTASLAFLATPLGAGLAAVALVAALVGKMAYDASYNMDQLRKATEAAAASSKKLGEGDTRRQQDQDALERLKQLNSLQSLDADQKAEAAKLTAQLSGRYDGLGLSIDGATGKVSGLAEAMAQFAKQQKDGAINQVMDDIRKGQEKLQKLRDSQNGDGVVSLIGSGLLSKSGDKYTKDGAAAKQKDIEAEMQRLSELKARLAALQGGDKSAVAGDPKKAEADIKKNIELTQKQIKAKQDAELEAAKKLAELNDSLIENEYNREVAMINRKYDEEAKRLKELGANTQAVEQARQIELDKAANKAKERWAKEKKEQGDAAKDAKDKRDKEAKDANDKIKQQADLMLGLQKDLAEAEAKQLEEKGDKQAAEAKRKEVKRVQDQLDNSDLEHKIEGLSEPDKQRARDLQRRIQQTQNDTPTKSSVFKSAGTFDGSAASLRGLAGSSKEAEIAKNTGAMAKTLVDIKNKKGSGIYK